MEVKGSQNGYGKRICQYSSILFTLSDELSLRELAKKQEYQSRIMDVQNVGTGMKVIHF